MSSANQTDPAGRATHSRLPRLVACHMRARLAALAAERYCQSTQAKANAGSYIGITD